MRAPVWGIDDNEAGIITAGKTPGATASALPILCRRRRSQDPGLRGQLPLSFIVVNPPRKGLQPPRSARCSNSAGKLIYVPANRPVWRGTWTSCRAGYRIQSVRPFDMFPRRQVETWRFWRADGSAWRADAEILRY
jgi:hypothetical protein